MGRGPPQHGLQNSRVVEVFAAYCPVFCHFHAFSVSPMLLVGIIKAASFLSLPLRNVTVPSQAFFCYKQVVNCLVGENIRMHEV
jgi:hypothetical protein